jgi:hypothetical protein
MAHNFEPLDLAEVSSEYERVTAEPGGQGKDFLANIVRLPEHDGVVIMRFLPRKKGQKLCCTTRLHSLLNPATGKIKSYHCPRNLIQGNRGPQWVGNCIICKYYSDLWKQSLELSDERDREEMQDRARKFKPYERYYYNVIVRQVKDKNGALESNVGPLIFPTGVKTHAKILRAIRGDESIGEMPLGDITHPVLGRDFRLIKKMTKSHNGKSSYANYDLSKFEDVSPLGTPEEIDHWLDNLHDLQALRDVKSEEELRQALRIHLGLVQTAVVDDDLAEFRGIGQNVANHVREDVVVSTPSSSEPETYVHSSTSSAEPETLADDDFMNELEGM